ncbi:iron donor protein CyaY [Zobellella endophytica]|uniref:Iron-sulfur cluster assembly protein CyaY n=1 Tax=Zobellella endophytica TaxID=2116700 RepID=A0A2P7R4I8_9GAMM|nr:iron donor protein CyaY [Zobellella endophytica]PSJ45134.1 iron donor protein CyaY [Zobellella endophytica]
MKDSEFHALADAIYQHIEECIDRSGIDIDCETIGGVMTLTFENGVKFVINRQEPLHQIWLATRENGHHFALQGDKWIDNRQGHELLSWLSLQARRQGGVELPL